MTKTFNSITRDLVHALRSLAKARAFTLVCIISLGIGMGAFVALLTFNRMLQAPARGINPAGLAELLVLPQGPLRAKAGDWAIEEWSYPDYQALRDADVGMDITGWTQDPVEFGKPAPDQKAAPRVTALYVSANYFRTFGVPLARGAGFDPVIDDQPLAEPRVVLNHGFWKLHAASDPDIVGKPLLIGGVPHTVVGVAPEDFNGHFHPFNSPETLLFIPLERHPRLHAEANLRDDRMADWVRVHGRLNAGNDIDQADAKVATMMASLARQYPASNEFKSGRVAPYYSLGAAGRPQSGQIFSILLSLAGVVLLIVCLNISGMMLVRGASRERELSIRAALGAGRGSLIQHLFLEALLLAVAGGVLSAFVLFGIPAIGGWYMGVPLPPEIQLDPMGVAMASGLCLLVSILFGLLPALRFSTPDLIPAMKDDSGGGGRQTIRVHRFAAMVQIGIAIPFLVVSGVMIDRTRTADFGFATDGFVTARVPAVNGVLREAGSIRAVRDNLQQATGVRSVAVAEGTPIDFDYRTFRVARKGHADFVTTHVTRVGENFLETVGAPLLRGRTITADDRAGAVPVAVISKPLADQLFPGAEAIGETVTVMLEERREHEFTVIGVSADFATSQLTTERPQILLPLPEALMPTTHLLLRGEPGSEPQLKSALEGALRQLGIEASPGIAFPGIVTGHEMVEKSKGDLVAEGTAVGVAGGLVLVLAALGILGVVGFMVTTRTKEIAVRMALGSTRLRVFALMLVDIVKLVVPGVAGGLVLAAVLVRTMEDVMGTPLTLGPDPLGIMEPVIYAIAATIAVSAALLAGLPAARRATTVQPMVAIKSE
jgi:putative ABC transport system permease protein